MSDQLWLQLPRDRVTERGYAVTQLPADVAARLTGTHAIDPLTGYAMLPLVPSMADPYAWTAAGADWLVSYPFVLPNGTFGAAVSHRADAAFSVSTTSPLPAGTGFFLGFICYGGGSSFTLSFGANSLLIDRGQVTWSRAEQDAARVELWHEEEWTTAIHYLYVYAIGGRLAARRLGGQRAKLALGMLLETGETTGEAVLPGGPVTLTGEGYLTFAVAPERHETAAWVRHATIVLPEVSTQQPTLAVQSVAPTGATVTEAILGPDGRAWDPDGPQPFTGAGWQVDLTAPSATGPNVYLTRTRLAFGPLVENDGATPVDLCTFTPAGIGGTGIVQQVELRRGPDPESCGLTCHLLTVNGAVAAYLQPHMKGRWAPGGTPWLTFYTSRPEASPAGFTSETVRIDCSSPWKLFQLRRWTGGPSYAGGTLAAAYANVAERAGLPAGDVVITSGTMTLPAEDADGEPLFDFQPGQPLAEVLLYLRDQFDPDSVIRFKGDGKLYIEPRPTEASGTEFVWTTPANEIAAVALGTSTLPRLFEWSERFDEEGLANDVWVIGRRRDGQPLVAVATDWGSIRDPLARNYVAGFRQILVVDAGLSTQGLCNATARNVLERRRRPRLTATMTGTAVADLYEEDLIEVEGRGLWRITSLAVTWSGDAPLGQATYDLEYHGEAA